MKKTLHILLALHLCLKIAYLKSQQSIDILGQQVADALYKQIKNKIPNGSKIAVLFFEAQKSTGNEKTRLGIRISEKTSSFLIKKFNNRDIVILTPVNTQEKKYFTPPEKEEDESEFFKKFNENQRPDFFILAKYYFSENQKTITCTDIIIKENAFKENSTNKSYAVEPVNVEVSANEINQLKSLHIEFPDALEDNYISKIFEFYEQTDSLVKVELYDLRNQTIIEDNGTLKINNSYALKIKALKTCYVYALSYFPEDKEHPYVIPLFPYDQNVNNKLVENKEYWVPNNGGFQITPPAGPMYIKIIASLRPIAFHITSEKDKNGYIYTIMNSDNAEIFWVSITKLLKQQVPFYTEFKTYFQVF